MKKLILVFIQWVIVLIYAKNGYMCGDPLLAYKWGVFFSVGNQLVLCGWIALIKISFWQRFAFYFSFTLAIIWANWFIPPVKFVVTEYGLFRPIMSYIVICLFITILTNFNKK